MWNAHELPASAISDRRLRQFVCTDYFHDSFINRVVLAESRRSVTLHVGCEREGAQYTTRERPEFAYRIEFLDCLHLELEATALPWVYLNGRFKIYEPPKHAFGSKSPPRCHYLRLQVLDGGHDATHVDIAFRGFQISRAVGSVDLRAARRLVGSPLTLASTWSGRPIAELRRLAARGSVVARSLALEALAARRDRPSVALAVACLRTRDEELLAAAVHATGILGSRKQVPHLANVLKRVSDRFARRQITEAIVRASAR